MDAALLNPDLRAFRFVPVAPARYGWQRWLSRVGTRRLPGPQLRDGVRHELVPLSPSGGVHVFTPADGGNGAALLWIHGGGMVIGSPAQDYSRSVDLAADLGITVVSTKYRLAPEHPFPAPLDDCLDAWAWLQSEAASRGIDPARVAISGQSAGGGLAAGLVQRLHDAGGTQPVAQWLFCPMLDDRTAADRRLDKLHHYLWDNKANRAGWTSYLGATPGLASVPEYAVPARRTDLAGLPPTWIGTGGIDLFRTEDVAYAEALRAAGVEVVLDEVAGAPHAFETIVPDAPVSKAYLQRADAWLAGRLAAR